jgi:hypothetical protein
MKNLLKLNNMKIFKKIPKFQFSIKTKIKTKTTWIIL